MADFTDDLHGEIIAEFSPAHTISYSIPDENGKKVKIIANLEAIVIANYFKPFRVSDLCFYVSNPENKEQIMIVPISEISSKVTLQSGHKFEPYEIAKPVIIDQINKGIFNTKKKSTNAEDISIILWEDNPKIMFSYPYEGGMRELRLDKVFMNEKGIYFRCFCMLKKSTRTFNISNIGHSLFMENKEYSMKDFFTNILNIDLNNL